MGAFVDERQIGIGLLEGGIGKQLFRQRRRKEIVGCCNHHVGSGQGPQRACAEDRIGDGVDGDHSLDAGIGLIQGLAGLAGILALPEFGQIDFHLVGIGIALAGLP